jgi:hypothetical protein
MLRQNRPNCRLRVATVPDPGDIQETLCPLTGKENGHTTQDTIKAIISSLAFVAEDTALDTTRKYYDAPADNVQPPGYYRPQWFS